MVDFFQCFREPFCEGFQQYYFIIIIIGLTFIGESLSIFLKFLEGGLHAKLVETPFPQHLPEISYNIIFDFAFFSAFSLIIVDLYKIVFGLNMICGWNVDAVIKFFLFINILISGLLIYLVTRYAIKEKSIIPSYSPEATIDSTVPQAIA